MFTKEDIVFSYTTKQAIKDGVLILIDQNYSLLAGVRIPVVITIAAYEREVLFGNPPPSDPFVIKQRIQNILSWYVRMVHLKKPTAGFFLFPVVIYQLVSELKSEIRQFDFDDPTPTLFIMNPNED